eukprot:161758-Hanusia_phi.AAC.1
MTEVAGAGGEGVHQEEREQTAEAAAGHGLSLSYPRPLGSHGFVRLGQRAKGSEGVRVWRRLIT